MHLTSHANIMLALVPKEISRLVEDKSSQYAFHVLSTSKYCSKYVALGYFMMKYKKGDNFRVSK